MNLRELAKELDLSTATVSVALFGDPGKSKLSAKTVERVRAYAAQTGYVPNRLARRIFQPQKNPVTGLLLKQDNAVDRNTPVLQTAMQILSDRNREYLVQNCNTKNIVSAIEQMLGFHVRQIILIGYVPPEALNGIERYKDLELYVLDFLWREGAPLPRCRCWMAMDRGKVYRELAEQLCLQGFGPLGGDENIVPWLRPYLTEDAVVLPSCNRELWAHGESLAPAVCQAVREGRCRTLLVRNDMLAVGIMEGVLKAGLRIPEDLMLFGFNALDFGAYAKVGLSSIRPPVERHLQLVLEHLLDGKELPDHVISEPEMILRNSSGTFVWQGILRELSPDKI